MIILSGAVVAVLITVTILLFTLFALDYKKIDFNFLNASEYENNQEFEQELLNFSKINNGASVFFINKTKATNLIEKAYPNLKVINIETVFPNSLKFNLAEREELFAIKNTLDNFSVIDADFKVLKVLSKADFDNLQRKPILIEYNGSHLVNLTEGSFIEETFEIKILKNASKSFLINSRDVEEQKTIFKNIVLLDNMLVFSLQDDYTIKVHSPEKELHIKLEKMLLLMGKIYPDYQDDYVLEIYMTQDGTLLSKFSLKN